MIRIVFIFFLSLASLGIPKDIKAPLGSYLPGQKKPLATIILDVGHGGTDLGARAQPPYCEEKKICLQTAKVVKKLLTRLGYHVVMTRETDAFVSLPKRVEIASQASGDLFVSVHFNSTRNPTAHGIEVFYYDNRENRVRASSSKKLAEAVLKKVINQTSAVTRGVKKGNFYVIRETTMPAILVEGGFISNPEERAQLRTREYQEKIALGIAEGIDQFMKKK